ncbi:MAG: hypothetical protein CMF48_06190 [Legionellales bacterium]|nr:hypothetical protein [Legionellales bacterium]|tara:strand:+ start:1 stop:2322 length:2322 start_codon:yes stop_codon:yes gene_type:complete
MLRLLLSITLILFASPVFAVDVFESPISDQSLYYLGQIFGNMGTTLQPDDFVNNGIPEMFRVFNTSLLSMGAIVVGYISVISIVQTAKEGEILGKKWSSVWLPMRAISGLGMLIPQASGYCSAQVIMIWIVAQGVGAANMLWDVVLDNYEAGYSMTVPSPLMGLESTAEGVFKAAVCMGMANQDPGKYDLKGPIELYSAQGGSWLYFGSTSASNSNHPHVCGRIQLITANDGGVSDSKNQEVWDIQKSAFEALVTYYQPYVEEALTSESLTPFEDPEAEELVPVWEGDNNFLQYGKSLLGDFFEQIRQLNYFSYDSARAALGQDARADGWMYAGSYYSRLVTNTSSQNANVNSVPQMKADSRSARIPEDNIGDELRNRYRFLAGEYLNYNDTGLGGSSKEKIAISQKGGGSMPGIVSVIFGPIFSDTMKFFMNFISNQAPISGPTGVSMSDPLVSMGIAGNTIVQIIEAAYIYGILGGIILIGVAYIMGGHQPAGWVMSAVAKFLIPFIVFLVTILLTAGLMLGIYIPLIPYMIFLFGTIGWFITVIEAVAAAPILALGLAIPSQDQWGKASHGLLLVLNLFMRPPLMIIGFIAAARILMTGADLINYSFRPALNAMGGELGVIAIPGVVMLYAGLMILVVNEGFQLINVLPDRVIRWIGGQPESVASRAQAMEGQAKESFQQASATSEKVAAGAAKWLAEKMGGEDKDEDGVEGGEKKNEEAEKDAGKDPVNRDAAGPSDSNNPPSGGTTDSSEGDGGNSGSGPRPGTSLDP